MSDEFQDKPKMPDNTLGQRLGMIGFLGLERLLTAMPIAMLCHLGRFIGKMTFYMASSRRKIVERNLRIVIDPALKGKKLSRLAKENFARMGMNILAAAKTATMNDQELLKHVDIIGHDAFEAPLLEGKSGICAVVHSGNWEILARIRAFYPNIRNYGSMYRQMDNPLMEEYLYKRRTMRGTQMFSKEGGIQAPLRFLKQKAALGILCDQIVSEGLHVPYFGKITGTTYLPALLYKRTDSAILGVCVRSTKPGHWIADMGTAIHVEEGEQSLSQMTIAINEGIEKLIGISPLDGFWMHHRWKVTNNFATQDEKTNRLLETMTVKPFRILFATPLAFDEAVLVLPMVRALKAARIDMQINIICPQEQEGFWKTIPQVAQTIVNSGKRQLIAKLNDPAIYDEGPYDLGVMLDNQIETVKALQAFQPIRFTGFRSHPMAKKAKFYGPKTDFKTSPLYHRIEDYLRILKNHHIFYGNPAFFPSPKEVSPDSHNSFPLLIAPFSTLGANNEWKLENWNSLCESIQGNIGGSSTLIALPQDEARAKKLAGQLGIEAIVRPAEALVETLRQASKVIAVDGLIPALASHAGTPCIVLFGSRIPVRYRPLGNIHQCLHKHKPCAGCGLAACPQKTKCIDEISVDEVKACL